VGNIHVIFFEGAFIEENLNTLASGQLALGVLGVDAALAASEPSLGAPRLNLFENRAHLSLPSLWN
jgi:hypothetical protein